MFLLKRHPISLRIRAQRERHSGVSVIWLCLVPMIPFGIALILMGKLLPAVDSRLGSPAEVIPLKSDGQDGYIRISISLDGKDLVAVDSNRRRIVRWPASAKRLSEATPLVTLLKTNVHESILTSSLSNRSHPFQTRVILAIDQHLTFYHLKPVLFALAESKVTNYAFETLEPGGHSTSRIQVKPIQVMGRR